MGPFIPNFPSATADTDIASAVIAERQLIFVTLVQNAGRIWY